MSPLKNKNSGFTLIELMIVIAIIGILASVALPSYLKYAKSAKFSEVVNAASSVRTLVDICYQVRGTYTLSDCDTLDKIGANTLDVTNGKHVASITMALGDEGAFTITGAGTVDNADYILTPTSDGRRITWVSSGSCEAASIC